LNTTIGGTSAEAGNVISGNLYTGIWLSTNQNVVAGNLIGTTATGLAALDNGDGVYITGNFNTIGGATAGARNVISGNQGPGEPANYGIGIDGQYGGGQYNLVEGNYIGTDITGNTALRQSAGMYISGEYNTIGGTMAGARNIISGNALWGISIFSSNYSITGFGNAVVGNYIGTDPTGTRSVANGTGISVEGGADDNTIGGTLPGEGNLISGNSSGIQLSRGTTNNLIQGNLIGTDKTGTVALGNAYNGIGIDGDNNTIGGTTAGDGNTIAFNGSNGVDVDSGTGNSILGNSIFSNGSPGIFLNSTNDANDNQSAPVLTSMSSSSGGTIVTGTLQSVASTTFRVEFFANTMPDPSGFGQGQTYLGFATVTTNGSGNASFNATGLAALPAGQNYLSATATNLSTGDTSQFDQDLLVTPTTTTVTSSMNPAFLGQSVTFTATVAAAISGAGTPAGSVDFVDATTGLNLGTVTLANGSATLSTSLLAVGANTITASYSGGSNAAGDYEVDFLPSSGSLTQTLSPTILILDPTAGGALSLSGNAGISIPGALVVDSNSKTALTASGNAEIKAGSIQVVGGVSKSGNATLSPAATTGVKAVPDPLAALAVPTVKSGAPYTGTPISESLSGNSTASISPGLYSQITVSGNASLKLASGAYVVQGGGVTLSGNASVSCPGVTFIVEGGGFSVSGNAAISGAGVTIFNAGSLYNATTGVDGGTFGSITLSGNASLSAPSSGPYAGILIFQARDNPKALSFSGNAVQGITGTIYALEAQLAESGNAQIGSNSNPVSIVVDTMTLSGNAVAQLTAAEGGTAFSPAQIRTAYGINDLSLDGTGQTIAIVDAYDDPQIYQALDTFDSQFGLTGSGPTLYQQYGPATSFLTVLNQNGQATSLPATDPAGAGTANWEMEESLDVDWAHAIAPGAQIILVEANSQSLSDMMAGAATAASQRGVSTVSMSWGFTEGQGVLAADEAAYDSTFAVPGVTFVASTGDYGAADPVYPAFSPNVLAVGGTSLSLNADNSYASETGWGYYSSSAGTFIGSGGGISQYETEPAYQERVQSTGSRTTPDVSFVADPATGAWVADPYNLNPSNPWEVVGGTSLSAPAWAGLIALVNQGRSAAGQSALNSPSPTQTQQSLYSLSQNDFNSITSGSNGYAAAAGYNLVTGLGTPVANLLVPDLIAGNFPSTGQVAAASPAAFVNSEATAGNANGPANVMNVLDALPMTESTLASSPKDTVISQQIPTAQAFTLGHRAAFADVPQAVDAAMGSAVDPTLVGDLAALAEGNYLTSAGDSQNPLLANYASAAVDNGPLVESLRSGGTGTESVGQVSRGSLGLADSLFDAAETTAKKADWHVALDRVFAEFAQDDSLDCARLEASGVQGNRG